VYCVVLSNLYLELSKDKNYFVKYQFEEMKSTQFFSGYIHNEVFYKVLYISLKFYNAYECQSQDIPNFLSHRIDRLVSNLIFGHKLHIGTPYRGKRFWTRQIPTSCLLKSGGIISEH
jgi:hypothetical protein